MGGEPTQRAKDYAKKNDCQKDPNDPSLPHCSYLVLTFLMKSYAFLKTMSLICNAFFWIIRHFFLVFVFVL